MVYSATKLPSYQVISRHSHGPTPLTQHLILGNLVLDTPQAPLLDHDVQLFSVIS